MDYIDVNGTTKFLDFESKNKKIFSVTDIDDVDTIINFSNDIRFLNIENNKNLKTISKFPKSLHTLVITNNQSLENMQLPNVKISISIFDNPLLNGIENQIDEYKKTKYYKSVYTTIITSNEDEFDDIDDIEIGDDLDKEILNIDEWIFTTNVDEYKKSPQLLHNNNNDFLINYRQYKGYEYPIITIPKGTILYNYDRGKNINIKDKYNKLYNLEENFEVEQHLKFFYPLPFAALVGIEAKYDYCNIVVINNDIQILCLLSPSPVSNETLRLQSKNKVINNFNNINYYDNKLTFKCDTYEHDLCIDLNMMKEMGLQGYISIAKEDSISNGDIWRKNIANSQLSEYIKEYLFKSCFTSVYQENNNLDYINGSLEFNLPNNLKNRLFGVPEIVLVPLNTHFFFDIDIQQNIFDNFNNIINFNDFNDNDSKINKIFYDFFNYSVIEICNLTELKNYLQSIEDNIMQNKQSLMFQLFSNTSINHNISSNTSTIEKTQFYDTDYISSYKNENKKNPYCCFETVGYHLLKNNKFGGKKYKTLKYLKKNKKNKTRYNFKKNKVIKQNNSTQNAGNGHYTNVKLIIERTKKGMLISYFQHSDE